MTTFSSMRTCPRRKAPSSVEKLMTLTSPQTRPVERISSFSAVMLPRTVPSTTMVFARMFMQVTRPVSPTTIIPRICMSPSKVPSMRTPPAPRRLPRQLIPGPRTEVTRSIAAAPVCPDELLLLLLVLFCRLNMIHSQLCLRDFSVLRI